MIGIIIALVHKLLHIFGIHWWADMWIDFKHYRFCVICQKTQQWYGYSNYSDGWEDE